MGQNDKIRTAFFAVWLLLLAAVGAALLNQEKFFAVSDKPIARLDRRAGSVQVRPEGLVRWRDTVDKQGFFDGDRVATGRSSKARIVFGPQRTVSLGEETQVQVTAISQSEKEDAYVITLVRGTLVANIEKNCTKCGAIIIRAGRDTYDVNIGTKVGVYKPAGRKAKKFDPKGPWPSQPAIIAPVAVPVPTATPVPKPKATALPAAKAKGVEAEITSPVGRTWWTTSPLSALGGTTLEIPLTPPATKPATGRWSPLVELSGPGGAGGAAKTQLIPSNGPTDLTARVSIDRIRRSAAVNRVDGYTEYAFSLRGGAVVTRDAEKSESLSDRRVEYRIRSYGEIGGAAVSIGLDKLSPDNGAGPWMEQKSKLSVESAPIVIQLASSQDYGKFQPYVRGAGAVGLSGAGVTGSEGIFVVRNKSVVAQLRGSAMDQTAISRVMELLGADFVFKGRRSAYHDLRGTTQNALVGWIGSLLDKGKVLYILKRNKLYPVNRDFIKTNTEVAQFVDSQAKAVFLEKVEILDYR